MLFPLHCRGPSVYLHCTLLFYFILNPHRGYAYWLRKGQTDIDVREHGWTCLLHMPHQESTPQPRYVPQLWVQPVTFQCLGRHSNCWAPWPGLKSTLLNALILCRAGAPGALWCAPVKTTGRQCCVHLWFHTGFGGGSVSTPLLGQFPRKSLRIALERQHHLSYCKALAPEQVGTN